MNFRIGQKVVCVNAGGSGPLPYGYAAADACASSGLREGEIYQIVGLLPETSCVQLRGIGNGWCQSRFRPLVERKTDAGMSILKSILADAENYKVKETV